MTETAATNDALVVENTGTSALGDIGSDAPAGETDQTQTEAAQTEAKPGETDSDGDDGAAKPETKVVPETYDLKAPEGFSLDPKHVELATPIFRELGLDNDGANKLMPVAAEFAQSVVKDAFERAALDYANLRKTAFESAKKQLGAAWDENLHHAAKVFDAFGAPKGSPLRESLEAGKWDNDPNMVQFFAKIGRAIGEDGFTRADGAAKTDVPIWDRIYDTPKA